MLRRVLVVLAVAAFGIGTAYAQEGGAGAGRVEIGAFPGGGMFFTQSANGNEPNFGNYALGGSVTLNLNRWIGIEGEGGGSVGLHQTFNVAGNTFTETRTPSMYLQRKRRRPPSRQQSRDRPLCDGWSRRVDAASV